MAERYNVLPSQAAQELEEEDANLVLMAMLMRSFTRTKGEIEAAERTEGMNRPTGPMVDLVDLTEARIAKEAAEARRRK